MKILISLFTLAFSVIAYGQPVIQHQVDKYDISEGAFQLDNKLKVLISEFEKISHKRMDINFFQDSVRVFIIKRNSFSVYISKDSAKDCSQQNRMLKIYGYILTHTLAHQIINNPCDTIPYLEFNADCISGYLLAKTGLVNSESELTSLLDDSLLNEYYYTHNNIRRFERHFAFRKGIKKAEVAFKDFIDEIQAGYSLFTKNIFNGNNLNYECVLNDGSKYYIEFPKNVYQMDNDKYKLVGNATALDTTFWYYWLQLDIGERKLFMNDKNIVFDTYGKVVGKVFKTYE